MLSKKTLNNDNTLKSILVSLINVNLHYGKLEEARSFLLEFKSLKDLTDEDKRIIMILINKTGINS